MAEQPAHLAPGAEQVTWCKYHCASCDECFRSVAAFDMHRRGSYFKNTRHCVEPDSLIRSDTGELVFEGLDGRCKMTNERDQVAYQTTVWRVQREEEEE